MKCRATLCRTLSRVFPHSTRATNRPGRHHRQLCVLHCASDGWVREARHLLSPNQDERPPDTAPILIVVHNISLPPSHFGGPDILRLFTNTLDAAARPVYNDLAGLRVSAHFLIRRNGRLIQFVSCQQRAWHAGVSQWRRRERCNDFSIGIELEGADHVPYTARQYNRLNALLRTLCRRYPIEAITGHSDIAPGRKTDPGPSFDWSRLVFPSKNMPNDLQ